MTGVTREPLRARLLEEGAFYVRWSLAGMFDDGGILDIKTYSAEGAELHAATPYPNEMSENDTELLNMGVSVMDAEHYGMGFVNGPGGYGWLVWDVHADIFELDMHVNWHGLDYEYFDDYKYDHVELMAGGDFDDEINQIAGITVNLTIDGGGREIVIEALASAIRFVTLETRSRVVRRGKSQRTEDELWCHVDIERLNDFLEHVGARRQSRIYYHNGISGKFSKSEDDYITEQRFSFHVSDREPVRLFVGGWSPHFEYDVMDNSDVLAADPDPQGILRQDRPDSEQEQ